MRKQLASSAIAICLGFFANGQLKNGSAAAIRISPHATHIAAINKDTILTVAGATYRFTVDTPEDKGLVSTAITLNEFLQQIAGSPGSEYVIVDAKGNPVSNDTVRNGYYLQVISKKGAGKKYYIKTIPMAIGGQLSLEQKNITVNTKSDLTLHYTAGQRSPDASVRIVLPAGINVTMENTTVNVIGRGDVKLKELASQSIGRVGTNYSYRKVGEVLIEKAANGKTVLLFNHLDLRPANGTDLKIVISNVELARTGAYSFQASYTTSQPQILSSGGAGAEIAEVNVVPAIADFDRVINRPLQYKEDKSTYTSAEFRWSQSAPVKNAKLMQSLDNGKTWSQSTGATIKADEGKVSIAGLLPGKPYLFRLSIPGGIHKGNSNTASFYTGKMDIKKFGVSGRDGEDNTDKINEAISYLNKSGGGTLLFSPGVYSVRTVHLQSNVYLYLEKGATLKALKGADAPETTWFSDKKYRSGLSPTDKGPYADPENYLTKQDVGHHYFRNAMFFGERLDNVKIIGNGYITGNGNLVTGDKVMNNEADNRADKMFVFKLCTNIEIGGINRDEDLWYDEKTDLPYYIGKDGNRITDTGNMLEIDRAGHFVLLATGTDNINVHNTYFGKQHTSQSRDIYDFMQCNNVTARNIFSKVSSDDIIKPGSDCSLGFTRPASKYLVRNIIGDTNCNLFQIGSETADDIMDIHVDNIYVLGANKAGFSISTNDGAHIKDIHLNCGHTGVIHSRSKMYRTHTPFFISISNRGRILGADVKEYSFAENGAKRKELLVTNVNIGKVENIILNGIDIFEVYAGSSFNGNRWKAFDGTQRRATPIVAGYALPDPSMVDGGLDFQLPDGRHTGYIQNIVFNDVHTLVKGGNASADTSAAPPELGVGQYNASNLKTQPAYGLWARHVQGLTVQSSTFNYEKTDGRYPIYLDDVQGAKLSDLKMMLSNENMRAIECKASRDVLLENIQHQ